jgi:hypothetical protein
MLNVKQIERIIESEFNEPFGPTPPDKSFMRRAAEKIAALTSDDGAAVAAARLENEVTSTLMDMTVATVLATLIEEEGGGRSNVSISPMSMDHMQQHYTYEVRNEGLIRHVSITMREDSPLKSEENWREPSNRHSLVDVATEPYTVDDLKPQAEPKEYNRPLWVISYIGKDGERHIALMHDQADAKRHVGDYESPGAPLPEVQNRFCLHADCPTTGCNYAEVTSNS